MEKEGRRSVRSGGLPARRSSAKAGTAAESRNRWLGSHRSL